MTMYNHAKQFNFIEIPQYTSTYSSIIKSYYRTVMEKFKNKVAVVTGSSSGIGRAISKKLVQNGVIVVGLARRLKRLEELNDELKVSNYGGKFFPMKCDVTKEIEVQFAFAQILSEIGPMHILVNNAGITRQMFLTDVNSEKISEVFDTNVKGVLLCSKEAMNCMIANSIKGHIININSVAGRYITSRVPNLNMLYNSSKHALTVLSEGLRRELLYKKTDVKVTNISPGWVRSEMSDEILKKNGEKDDFVESFLEAEDIADACISVLGTPPKVLISELTIMSTHQVI